MNLLPRVGFRLFVRFAETMAKLPTKCYAEQLTNRALVRLHGPEVVPFLQGLITNDMNHLHRDGNKSMFTMFLSNKGRVMYDAIIYRTPNPNTYLIECDKEVSSELRRHLRLFRVRKKIDIDCITSDYCPWVVYNPIEGGDVPQVNHTEANSRPGDLLCAADPRVKALGVRVIQPKNRAGSDLQRLFVNSEVNLSPPGNYNAHRYAHGVGEGIIDHPTDKCFPLEANGDFLHGISFQKGCYIGQELTARVYHTGVVRKRLMPLKLNSEIEEGITNVQTQAGAIVGQLRGTSKRHGLALLRVEQALKTQNLMIDGDLCQTFKPDWWPPEVQSRPRRL